MGLHAEGHWCEGGKGRGRGRRQGGEGSAAPRAGHAWPQAAAPPAAGCCTRDTSTRAAPAPILSSGHHIHNRGVPVRSHKDMVRNIGRVGIKEYTAYLEDLHRTYPDYYVSRRGRGEGSRSGWEEGQGEQGEGNVEGTSPPPAQQSRAAFECRWCLNSASLLPPVSRSNPFRSVLPTLAPCLSPSRARCRRSSPSSAVRARAFRACGRQGSMPAHAFAACLRMPLPQPGLSDTPSKLAPPRKPPPAQAWTCSSSTPTPPRSQRCRCTAPAGWAPRGTRSARSWPRRRPAWRRSRRPCAASCPKARGLSGAYRAQPAVARRRGPGPAPRARVVKS